MNRIRSVAILALAGATGPHCDFCHAFVSMERRNKTDSGSRGRAWAKRSADALVARLTYTISMLEGQILLLRADLAARDVQVHDLSSTLEKQKTALVGAKLAVASSSMSKMGASTWRCGSWAWRSAAEYHELGGSEVDEYECRYVGEVIPLHDAADHDDGMDVVHAEHDSVEFSEYVQQDGGVPENLRDEAEGVREHDGGAAVPSRDAAVPAHVPTAAPRLGAAILDDDAGGRLLEASARGVGAAPVRLYSISEMLADALEIAEEEVQAERGAAQGHDVEGAASGSEDGEQSDENDERGEAELTREQLHAIACKISLRRKLRAKRRQPQDRPMLGVGVIAEWWQKEVAESDLPGQRSRYAIRGIFDLTSKQERQFRNHAF